MPVLRSGLTETGGLFPVLALTLGGLHTLGMGKERDVFEVLLSPFRVMADCKIVAFFVALGLLLLSLCLYRGEVVDRKPRLR